MIRTNKALKINNPLDHFEAKRIKHCIEAVLKKDVFGALIVSKGGLGKTRNIREIIQEHGLDEDIEWIHVAANITDTELYKTLFDHKDKVIFFDDIGSAAKTIAGITILKQATETKDGNKREISWVSPTFVLKDYPKSFEFSGRLIMCLNMGPDERNADNAALRTRFLSCVFDPSNKTVMEMIYSIRDGLIDGKISEDEFEEIFNFIAENATEDSDLNIRLFKNAVVWYRLTKKWQKYVMEDLGYDSDTKTVLEIEHKGLRGKAATDEWSTKTGKRKSTFYNILIRLKTRHII